MFLIIYKWDLMIPKITFSFKSRIQDTCNWALLPVGVAIDNTKVKSKDFALQYRLKEHYSI